LRHINAMVQQFRYETQLSGATDASLGVVLVGRKPLTFGRGRLQPLPLVDEAKP